MGAAVTIESPVMCQVDECRRRAAASVVEADLPCPIQLCATHTEDFRINRAAWTIQWSAAESRLISLQAAPAARVGRSSSEAPVKTTSSGPGWARLKGRLWDRRRSGS